MPQLHFSVDELTAKELASRAAAKGESLSKYLADLVKTNVPNQWPEGYLKDVLGSCADSPIAAPADLPVDDVVL